MSVALRLELYNPHPVQLQIHNSHARYRIARLGRQAGKSTGSINELLKKAWENPNTHYWFVSPTYQQALTQYRRCLGQLSSCWQILLKKNQTELRLKLINQSTIRFVSGEVFQNLRGETLDGSIIDEVREQQRGLWSQVIRPMLTTTKGWCLFLSTPNGYDDFYDLYERARMDHTGEWAHFHAPSTCNPLFTMEEYEAARREMSEAEFDQEINANFRDLVAGKAYLNHGEHNWRTDNPFTLNGELLNKHIPIAVALDFNVDPMAWTLGQVAGGRSWWYDEIWIKNTNTQKTVPELIERVKEHKAGVVLVGDASGDSRHSSATESDYAIICEALMRAGIPFENLTPDANPPVKDRVNTMNAKMKAADGSVSFWYHPQKCPRLRKDLERVVWKPGASAILDQTTDSELTHSSDGVGYHVYATSDQWKPSPGLLRVIQR